MSYGELITILLVLELLSGSSQGSLRQFYMFGQVLAIVGIFTKLIGA